VASLMRPGTDRRTIEISEKFRTTGLEPMTSTGPEGLYWQRNSSRARR
jgi:hypothetical protein